MAGGTDSVSTDARARRRSPLRRAVVLVLGVAMLAAVVVPALAVGTVIWSGRQDDRTGTDAIVVLGAAQFWGRPSPVLEARLAHGKDLLRGGVAPRIVTVGGNQPGDRTTEAQAGKDWLVAAGLPPARVRAVPSGRDTLESLRAVAVVMAERGWTSATIVTDPAHLARSLAMARSLGIDAHGSPTTSGSGSSLTLDYVARESAGLLWFEASQRRGVDRVVGP